MREKSKLMREGGEIGMLLHALKGIVTLNLQATTPQQFDAIFGSC
jgi:hypothetical protein